MEDASTIHRLSRLEAAMVTAIMEAVVPALVAHSPLLIPTKQRSRNARTVSCMMLAFGRTAGSVPSHLCEDSRWYQQTQLLHRSCSVVRTGAGGRMQIQRSAVDAAPPFENESSLKLKVGIVGFGNFGQFLSERMMQQGHVEVLAHSRRDYSDKARKLGVTYFRDADDFCEEHPEVVVLCTSILSTEAVLQSLPLQRLKRNTLFVDVLSVKQFPKTLFLQVLPPEFDVLCTHPMFGPESGKGSWYGLPFVYDKVRIGSGRRSKSAERFLDIFASEGCRMVEMSCAEHDRFAASSQFITHTVGRILGKLQLEPTPINTMGYKTLLELFIIKKIGLYAVQNTSNDSFELYYGLFTYNPNAPEELKRLEVAFDSIKKQLFGQLHTVLRKQLFSEMDATNGNFPQGLIESPSTKQKLII